MYFTHILFSFVSLLKILSKVQGIHLKVNNIERNNGYVYKYNFGEKVNIKCYESGYSLSSINMMFYDKDDTYLEQKQKKIEQTFYGVTYSVEKNKILKAEDDGLRVYCFVISLLKKRNQIIVTFHKNKDTLTNADKPANIPLNTETKYKNTTKQKQGNHTNSKSDSRPKKEKGKDKLEEGVLSTDLENGNGTDTNTTNAKKTSILEIPWLAIVLSCCGIGIILIIFCVILISMKKARNLNKTVEYENVKEDMSSNQTNVDLEETRNKKTSDHKGSVTEINMMKSEALYSKPVPKSMRNKITNELTYASLEFEDLAQVQNIRSRRNPSNFDKSAYANVRLKSIEPTYTEVQKDYNIK